MTNFDRTCAARLPRIALPRHFRWVLTLAAGALLLAGCGGGQETVPLQQTIAPQTGNYSGPPPATADTQAFMNSVWDSMRAANRCGGCHTAEGQAPRFARSDDVNLAYQAANTIVDLQSPADSLMVTYVAGGHNCWLTSNQACADILVTLIGNWAGGEAGRAREIELVAPPSMSVGESRAFPEDPMLFGTTVYPPLATYCAECHSTSVAGSVAPFFADANLATAYDAARSRMNLAAPELSRFVIRLRNEFHNCWSDCADDAQQIEDAIIAFINEVPPTEVDSDLVVSKALTLENGIQAAGGNRAESHQIALFEFKEGAGDIAFDTSGVDPAVNLTLSGDIEWVGGWGIAIESGKAQASTQSSRKLHDLIRGTGEYSLEAWVVPGNVTQENAHIAGYSAGTMARNFTLGQNLQSYQYRNRSAATGANGDPVLATPDADQILQATLQHVVASFDPVEGRRLHVNGVQMPMVDEAGGGLINDWDDTFALVLGNEVSGDRQWQGTLRLVAIHNRALGTEEIQQNMAAGVGEKFFLLFNVSDQVGIPDSFILFEVNQFDSHAYLFTSPRFISLNPDAMPVDIVVRDLRIGINGSEAGVGQAFRDLDVRLGGDAYVPGFGQLLSSRGAVIALEQGPTGDEFFLSFGQLGDSMNLTLEPAPPPAPPPADTEPRSEIGLRTFDRINASMAAVTGVPATHAAVQATFDLVRQQLPTTDGMDTFVSAHQIGVMQLAVEYCNVLVKDAALRSSYFPGFDFAAGPSTAFAGSQRNLLLDPLINRMMGSNLASQPDFHDVRDELDRLVDRLIATGGGSGAARTIDISMGACAALLASAPLLVN